MLACISGHDRLNQTGLFVLPIQRLIECYELDSPTKVTDALLIYDHFYQCILIISKILDTSDLFFVMIFPNFFHV